VNGQDHGVLVRGAGAGEASCWACSPRRQRYRAVLAVIYFVPLLLSSAAVAIAYKALLDPNFGLGPGLKNPRLGPGLAGQLEPGAVRGRLRDR